MRAVAAVLALSGCTLIFGDERTNNGDGSVGDLAGTNADLSVVQPCMLSASLSVGPVLGIGEGRVALAATGKSFPDGPFLAVALPKDGTLRGSFFFGSASNALTKVWSSCVGCNDLALARTTSSEAPVGLLATPFQTVGGNTDLSMFHSTQLACPSGTPSHVTLVRDDNGVFVAAMCGFAGFNGAYISDAPGDMSRPPLPLVTTVGVGDLRLTRTYDGAGFYAAWSEAPPGGQIYVTSFVPSATTSLSVGTMFANFAHMGPLGFDVMPGAQPVAAVAAVTASNELQVAIGNPNSPATVLQKAPFQVAPRPLSLAAGQNGFVIAYDDGSSINTVFVDHNGNFAQPVRIDGAGGSAIQVTYDQPTNQFGLAWVHDDGSGTQSAFVGRLTCQ
jgi:hypothetical protein